MAGDTHGNLAHSTYLVMTALANDCDRVFVLGDFGFWEHTKKGVKFLDSLNEYAAERNVVVYFLDGNHDKTSLLVERYSDQVDDEGFLLVRPNIRYAGRGHRWTWDSVRFASFGGAYSVDKEWRLHEEEFNAGKYGFKEGDREFLWFPEEEFSDEEMDLWLEDDSHVDVILAHDKPRGANPKWNRKDFVECVPNQDRLMRACRVLRPSLFMHGHLHHFYTDEMWYGAGPYSRMHVTKVVGLLPDPEAGDSGHYPNKKLSWQVLDTDEKAFWG